MRVLVVEDMEGPREFLRDALELENHEVITAVNGQNGFDTFCECHPDLVITDIEMPKMNGLQMLEKIRKESTDCIVVIITGHGSETYASEALRLGADNYLKKPVSPAELSPLIAKYQSVLENRTITEMFLGMTIRREFTMEFDNSIAMVDNVVDYLIRQSGDAIPQKARLSVHLGLLELLMNAIEHGNLEITYDEKSAAVSADKLDLLRRKRLEDPRLAARKVTVTYKQENGMCEWLIADEGKGFDWEAVPDPLDPQNLYSANGRGILISRRHFDELEYLGCGNAVRVRKKIAIPEKTQLSKTVLTA